ncbi:MAG: phage head-tail connector protein, partial [Alphaproteobacteria bacterium]|nr:phage head-tail connector protein [Alphaproteobacteria bacterium]
MSLQLTTPPATEPITLAEAKTHLKVDTTDDDALITRLIA